MRLSCLSAVFLAVAGALAAAPDDYLFSEKLYPAMQRAQCQLCHNDNGVAAGTRFEFPPEGASIEAIEAFGRSLAVVVDREDPERSPLYLKPTNRTPHPGGERVKQGSEEEKLLLAWVRRLASFDPAELASKQTPASATPGPKNAGVRRLTHSQYNNAVRDLLGELSRPSDYFPPEDFIHGFRNQTQGQSTSPLLMEAYSASAERLARNAFRGSDRNNLIPCEPSGSADEHCLERFVRELGLRAFRRPLDDREAQRYTALGGRAARATDDFLAGASIIVEAMLQSPHFLMRVEHGPGSSWESYDNAERLAFFLWDTIPDEKLLALAAAGKLASPEQIEAMAREMLESPRAQASMEEFLAQWLRFDRALKTIRDRKHYPQFNAELAAAMAEETRRLFNDLVWNDKSFMELFTADYTFINTELALIYELPEPPEAFVRVSYPTDSVRAGVLGQGVFLTLTSKPSETSPTDRGLFVREHFLCQDVPPPPPGVNANLPAPTDAKPMTNRQRLRTHLESESCSSCHRLVDPIGFGLEHFDAIGQYRGQQVVKIPPTRDEVKRKLKTETTEHALEIDATAEVVGIPDSSFSSPKGLGQVLAASPLCQKCVAKQLFRYAMGRSETQADRQAIEAAAERFRESGFSFRELILAIVTSKPFMGGPS